MNKDTRTKNTVRNMLFGTTSQVLMLILNFVSRSIFIKILSEEYLGVNGLFTNILTILSLAELGISNAIMYGLYKPLANKDKEKVAQLMHLYGKIYSYIGLFILGIGLCLIPFIRYIIGDVPKIPENITFIYLLYLSEIVLSYFYCYKQSILVADQKEYIKTTYKQIFSFLTVFLKALVLILTRNFIFYLIIQILIPYIGNICASYKAEKMYPFINDKVEELSKDEKKDLFKNVKSLSLYRVSNVVLDSSDNIIITKLLGLITTGFASNYLLIISSCKQLLLQVTNSFTASVGNLNAIETEDKKHEIFNKLYFFSFWLYGFFGVMMGLLINHLIIIWIGNDYLLSQSVLLALIFNFYIVGIQNITFTYRTTMGLFVKSKYVPLIAAILNIVLSIILAKPLGLTGIFLATGITRLVTFGISDPYLIYKYGFKKNLKEYYINFIKYLAFLIFEYVLIYYVLLLIPFNNLGGFLLKGVIGTIIFNLLFVLFFRKNNNYKALFLVAKDLIVKLGIKQKIKKIIAMMLNFIFKFFKVKENKIIFQSGRNRADDNPFFICKYLNEQYKDDYDLIFIVSRKTDLTALKANNIKYVYSKTLKEYYHLATSKYWIRSQSIGSLIKKKPNQSYIYVDHATSGMKKCGYDITNEKDRPPLEFTKEWDYYVQANQLSLDICRSSTGYQGRSLALGQARNDFFFNYTKKDILRIKKRLGIDKIKNKKIVLYAPTFRDYELELGKAKLPINKLAEIDDICVVVTCHPLMKYFLNEDKLPSNFINAIEYDNFTELLLIADYLITDYSSAILDFSILNRLTILYPYDYDEYIKYRSGFHFDYKKELPSPICYSEDELVECIKNIGQIEKKYLKKLKKFNEKVNYLHDGKATYRFVCELKKGTFDKTKGENL